MAIAFTDNAGITKRQVVIGAKYLIEKLRELKIGVYAACGPDGDAALKHYGFVPHGPLWRLP